MDIETLKKDLEVNSQNYNTMVNKRNTFNVEILRMEGVLTYIRAVIDAETKKAELGGKKINI